MACAIDAVRDSPFRTYSNNDRFTATNELDQARTHNQVNEIPTRDPTATARPTLP